VEHQHEYGGYYTIDLAQSDVEGESPIVEWWPGLPNASNNRRAVANDFGAFLLERVQDALEE
jgi:hypothetical protein